MDPDSHSYGPSLNFGSLDPNPDWEWPTKIDPDRHPGHAVRIGSISEQMKKLINLIFFPENFYVLYCVKNTENYGTFATDYKDKQCKLAMLWAVTKNKKIKIFQHVSNLGKNPHGDRHRVDANPDPDPDRHQHRNSVDADPPNTPVLAGCSLLMAEVFLCSVEVPHRFGSGSGFTWNTGSGSGFGFNESESTTLVLFLLLHWN